MDKMTGEEDFKGLEEEIDDAVDRLFVENKRGVAKSFSRESPLPEPSLKPSTPEPSVKPPTLEPFMEPPTLKPSIKSPMEEHSMESAILEPSVKPPILEPSVKTSFLEPSYQFELGKEFDLERSPRPPSTPVPSLKSIENMEAQLLSLEWEITEDKVKKTKEEVIALRELLKQRADIVSILSAMEKVLIHMSKHEENIQPSWIKFLLDSKETIKLLMRKETEGEINTYKQLAHHGIEARFSCLEGIKDTQIIQPLLPKAKGVGKAEVFIPGEKKIEDMSNKMNFFMEKVEEIFRGMKQQISKLEETTRRPPGPSMEVKSKPVGITIFKVDDKLFGVETEKVFKLFKLPVTFHEKYSDQSKIRLKDLEVRMINLKKIFSISGGSPTGEMRILTVKDNGEYKGLMVDQVLNNLSALFEKGGELGEYFSGVIHSTYQEQPVEIPILDLKKF